jgi:uncharacterized MAPEG superfamily protein
MKIKPHQLAMLKSWAKVFAAAVLALFMNGERDPRALLLAGLAAVAPVIYSWLDPSDNRWGRGYVAPRRKAAAKKA